MLALVCLVRLSTSLFLMPTQVSCKGPWVLHLCMSLHIFGVRSSDGCTQAPGQSYLMKKYHIGIDLASSGLSFYVLGFASGPLICGYSYHAMIVI
jgi:hypothetical protein